MSSVPSQTLVFQVRGSPIQFCRTTDPNSPPYFGKGCSRLWLLTLLMPRRTTPKLMGKSNGFIILSLSNYDTTHLPM